MRSWLVSCEVSQGTRNRIVNLVRRVLFLRRSFLLQCVEVKGVPKDGDNVFCWTYIGEGESLEYLKKLYFCKIESQRVSKAPLFFLRRKIREAQKNGCLLSVEINRLLEFLLPAGGFRTYPWIRQKVFLGEEDFARRRHYIEENYGRKARKYGYTFTLARERDAVKSFYERLYAPYMTEKFKDLSHARSLDEFLSLLSRGFLLQVWEDGIRVAGIVCHRGNRSVTAFAFGLAPDYADHLHRGALSAAYYFLFQWAQESGLETVDLLRSRPHICDGVYEHKKRWGAVVVDDGWSHTSLRIYPSGHTLSPGVFGGTLVRGQDGFVELGKVLNPGGTDEAQRVGQKEASRA